MTAWLAILGNALEVRESGRAGKVSECTDVLLYVVEAGNHRAAGLSKVTRRLERIGQPGYGLERVEVLRRAAEGN